MEEIIRGKAYVVGDNVDTDQIIPAEYLSYNPADPEERKFFGMYAMSGVPTDQAGLPDGGVPMVAEGEFAGEFTVIIGGRNFGCGSSREHAPLALAEAGVQAVVAQSYARIFYRNCVNGGYLVPFETPERVIDGIATGDEVEIRTAESTLKNITAGREYRLASLGDVEEIIAAGGLFEYARRAGIV